ncbi:ABC transporter permease [Rhodovastum atsumiense]|uniref:ABC transporter permease n=1 Tax=Rhodovastum atsumiense TaxID=504468 RepID=UPI001EF05A93|nr:ABC transporter permease [Rhodovastum atsumiense]CAH2598616.1 ABC transporter permease [Rhodovastum atsumiense]
MATDPATVRRPRATPYWLCLPALLLYGVMLATPLAMTALLSFNSYSDTEGVLLTWGLHNYTEVLSDGYFHTIFLRTLRIALATTVICTLIGVPEAWIISRLSPRWRGLCLLVVLGPLLISVVVRTLGWTILMGRNGLINQGLQALHLSGTPVELLFTETGIIIALVHVMVPFMVLAVWTALQGVDPAGENAAISLGASDAVVFFRIVLPQVMQGVLSGSLIVFSLSASAFATPALIGGRRLKVAATAIYDEFLATLNWPLGAAIACLLVASVMAIMLLWNRIVERRTQGATA